jgi:hypothetical protein
MTKGKHLKRRVRDRTAKTGESYTAALRHLRMRGQEAITMSTTTDASDTELLIGCTFCGKTQKEVKKLIAGPGVYICDECIGLCNDILQEEGVAPKKAAHDQAPSVETSPVDVLLSILGGMARTSSTMEQRVGLWAKKLRDRGVTRAQLARTVGVTEEELSQRFGI